MLCPWSRDQIPPCLPLLGCDHGRPNQPWSKSENRTTITAYLDMLEAQMHGRSVVKREIRDQVAGRIGRSESAVEYKFRNISAVLQDLGSPHVDGYSPLANYQRILKDQVASALRSRGLPRKGGQGNH